MKYNRDYKQNKKQDEFRNTCDRCDFYEKRSKRHGWCKKKNTPTQPLSTACKLFELDRIIKRANEMMREVFNKRGSEAFGKLYDKK